MSNHLDQHKGEFQGVIDHFHKDLQSLRTGRASAALVDGIHVEAYDGQSMELKSIASITTPDAKTVQIEPWDKSIVKSIEKALIDASLGMMPNTAGTVIRLVMPPMTEEGRKNMVKIMHQKEEAAKIGIRNVREKVKSAITDEEKKKLISEDDRRKQLEMLDKVVGEWNDKVKKMSEEKEIEIMTI